jgi:hypothetical protein
VVPGLGFGVLCLIARDGEQDGRGGPELCDRVRSRTGARPRLMRGMLLRQGRHPPPLLLRSVDSAPPARP